jgi:hypothetical protein
MSMVRNIEHSIDLALNCNYDIILTGDLNINQLNNNNCWSVDVFLFNQLSVNESISWQEFSAEIISILDTML